MRFSASFVGVLSGAALLLAPAAGSAQRLLPSQLQPDVALLREALVTHHPGLYRHVDSVTVERRLDALTATFSQPRTLLQAYQALAVFLASLGDGHTYPNPLNQTAKLQAQLLDRPTALPCHFRLVGERAIISTALDPKALPAEAEILQIDGRQVADILDSLVLATRGDGPPREQRLARLQLDGPERAAAFDVLYPLFFPVGPTFRIELRESDIRQPHTVTVPAVRTAVREATLQLGRPEHLGWRLDFPDPRTARLTLPDFATWTDDKFDWKGWLRDAFTTLQRKNIAALVLDLRACEGGNDEVSTELLRYLTPRPLRAIPEWQLWRSAQVDPGLAGILDSWNPALKKLNREDFAATGEGYYVRRDFDPKAAIIQPYPQAFRGEQKYALVGPRNASAAFRLARELKENHLATLVGQSTGGNRRGITGGQFFMVRLPNTGLEVDLPLISYAPLRAQPDEGIEPDELVETTVETIRTGADPEMQRVTELLRDARTER